MQRDLLADRRHVAQRLGRDREAVADAAAAEHDDVVGPADRDLAPHQRDHADSPSPARLQRRAVDVADRDGERVGRVVGLSAARGARSSAWTMRATWSLPARPLPQTAPLTCCGV